MQRSFVIELDSDHVQVRADGKQGALFTPSGVQLHLFERPAQRQFTEDLGSRLRFAAFSSDGRWLAASADERLGVWDLEAQGPGALTDEGAEASPYCTPDGQELFASRRDDICLRWRIAPPVRAAAAPGLERLALPRPSGFTWLSLASNQVAWTSTRGSQLVGLNGRVC